VGGWFAITQMKFNTAADRHIKTLDVMSKLCLGGKIGMEFGSRCKMRCRGR